MAFKNLHILMTGDSTHLRYALADAVTNMKVFDGQLETTNATMYKLIKGTAAAGLALGVLGTVGFVVAVNNAKKFETAMRNVNSISKLTEQRYAALSEEVLNLSTQLPQSAVVLAEGLYEISSSGFAGEEGLDVLEAAATSAAAGLSTTDKAAVALTAVLNAYGKEASESADISDILFATVDQGVVSFEEMAGVTGNLVGIGANAGVAFEEMAAGLAALTRQGIRAGPAGTAMARMVKEFIAPVDNLQTLIESWGYATGTQALQAEGLYNVMMRLQEATGGQAQELLKLFPNIMSSRAAMGLLANEGRTYAEVSEKIASASGRAGAAQGALAEQSKGLEFQWDMLISSLTAGAIRFGQRGLGPLNELVRWINEMTGPAFSALDKFIEAVTPWFRNLSEVVGNLGTMFRHAWNALGPLVTGFAALAAVGIFETILGITQAMATMTRFFAENEAAAMALTTVLAASLGPKILATTVNLAKLIATASVAKIKSFAESIALGAMEMKSLGAAGFLANVGIGVALVAIGLAIRETRQLKSEIEQLNREKIEPIGQSFGDSAYGEYRRTMAQAQAARAELRLLREDHQRQASTFGEALGITFSEVLPFYENAGQRAKIAREDMEAYTDALERRLGAMRGNAESARYAISAALDIPIDDISLETVFRLAEVAGIDLATALQSEANPALVEAAEAARDGAGAFEEGADALDDLYDAQTKATQALVDYAETQKALLDPVFAVQKAQEDLQQSYRDYEEALADVESAELDVVQAREKLAEARADGTATDVQQAEQDLEKKLRDVEEAHRDVEEALRGQGEAAMDLEQEYSDLMVAFASGEVDRMSVIATFERWAEQGWITAEALAVLKSDLDSVIEGGDEWANKTLSATLTADGSQAEHVFDNMLGKAEEYVAYDGWMVRLDLDARASEAEEFENLLKRMGEWDNYVAESRVYVDATEAYETIDQINSELDDWEQANGVATAEVYALDAYSEMRHINKLLEIYDSKRAIAEARLKDEASAELYRLDSWLRRLDGSVATTTVRTVHQVEPGGGGYTYQEDGGILRYANGTEDHRAQIAPAGAWRVWAEPETGGEAYIPLALAKRSRSMAILQEVARMFGHDVVPNRLGSMYLGGSHRPQSDQNQGGGGTMVDRRSYTVQLPESTSNDDALMELRKLAVRMP